MMSHRQNYGTVVRKADAAFGTSLTDRMADTTSSDDFLERFMLQLRFLAAAVAWGGILSAVIEADDRLPRVPEGYTVELVAGPEQVRHPMMGCFDDRGRLYVCESAGTNRKAGELLDDPQDSIKVLEDTDGDGVYDKSWTFADKLVFPQGCLWYRGAVYTCSSPYLWKLEDTDGDGVCDKRTVLVKSFGFSGNAADIHGPFLSPDGRLYWCDGRHGHEIRDLGDGDLGGEDLARTIPPHPEPGLPNPEGKLLTKGKAARVFSCLPDGSDLRVFAGGGMDNPVEVDFWETGEVIGTVNLFYGRPRGDVLVHWIDGGVYPRDDQQDSIDEFPWTGGLLPPVTNYGHIAISGACRYRSAEFRSEFGAKGDGEQTFVGERGLFFVSEFNTHKVVRTLLERDGATFKAVETTDFLVSDNPDFHPTDVLEDADGSLLVIDTGGWFRIGCPTSQVAKPEISGGIYRIRKKAGHTTKDPWGREIAMQEGRPEDLAQWLGDPRPAVRERAIEETTRLLNGAAASETSLEEAIAHLQDHLPVLPKEARVSVLWAIARTGDTHWTPVIETLLNDRHPTIRIVALRVLQSLTSSTGADSLSPILESQLVDTFAGSSPAAAREAAAWLASTRPSGAPAQSPGLTKSLLQLAATPGLQPHLQHALIHALQHSGTVAELRASLSDSSPAVQRAALIALSQREDGGLQRDDVVALLATTDSGLLDAAFFVISRRQGWAAETTTLLRDWLKSPLTDSRSAIIRRFIAAQSADPAIQKFVAEELAAHAGSPSVTLTLLEALGAARIDTWPDVWTTPVRTLLESDSEQVAMQSIRLTSARRLSLFDDTLRRLAADTSRPDALRVEALSAVVSRMDSLDDKTSAFLHQQLETGETSLDQLRVASALASAPLNDSQLMQLAAVLPRLPGAALGAALPAFQRSESAVVGAALVKHLASMDDLPNVTPAVLREVLSKFPSDVRQSAAVLLDRLAARDAADAERITALLPLAEGGNADRGRYVFFGKTAACGGCHRVGKEGAQIGPDLSTISRIRQPRDLLESILLPSASFARGYEPYVVITSDGLQHAGILAQETSDTITLRSADLSEVRIPRSDIELLKESATSIMPQGLEAKLNEQELRDLLAYLQSLK